MWIAPLPTALPMGVRNTCWSASVMAVSSAPSVRRRCAQRDGTAFTLGPTASAPEDLARLMAQSWDVLPGDVA
jgi:hypothetical protein